MSNLIVEHGPALVWRLRLKTRHISVHIAPLHGSRLADFAEQKFPMLPRSKQYSNAQKKALASMQEEDEFCLTAKPCASPESSQRGVDESPAGGSRCQAPDLEQAEANPTPHTLYPPPMLSPHFSNRLTFQPLNPSKHKAPPNNQYNNPETKQPTKSKQQSRTQPKTQST